MAIGFDRSKIQSMVIFNEISSDYSIGDNIECRFYIDPEFINNEDKIGLFKIGWTDKSEFIVLKEIKNSVTDEFGEKKLIFPGNQLPKDESDQEYQFCYFHLSQNDIFHLCGTSIGFRFYKSKIEKSVPTQNHYNPTAPQLSVYQTLNTDKNINQTHPKRLYDTIPEELSENLLNDYQNENKTPNKSFEHQLAAKERELSELKHRYAQKDRLKDLQIESLNAAIKLSQENLKSLENELKLKLKSDDRMKITQNELMDTIKLTEAKNFSLEEVVTVLRKKCSEEEQVIDELKAKLAITQNELDLYRTSESNQKIGNDTENRFLRDKVEELKSKYEKVKNIKEVLLTEKIELEKSKMKIEVELEMMKENLEGFKRRLDKSEDSKIKITAELKAKEILMKKHIDDMKSSYKSLNDIIIQARHQNSNITIYVNEMKQEMKDYAISHSSKALKSFNDIKSIAESIVYAFNERYGKSWNCFIGENIAHNKFYYVLGTYLSFSFEDLKIILFKTVEMLDYSQALKSAQNTKKVEIIYKNDCIDSAFETLVTSLALESIDGEFADYGELSNYLTKELVEKYGNRYGNNWLVVSGVLDYFDSNFSLSNRRYIELQIASLKFIVLQIDEKHRPQPRLLKTKSLKV